MDVIIEAKRQVFLTGRLDFPDRKKLWRALGEAKYNEEGYAIRTKGLIRRVKLAQACVKRILPIWDEHRKGDRRPFYMLKLADAYYKLEQYDKAIELLESLSNVKLYSVYKLVHRINLCICYFYQKQTDCAIKLYENSQRIFNPYRNSKLYGGNIVILDIFAAISIKDYVRASELLQTAQSTWNDPCFLNEYRYLEESIYQSQAE